MLRFWILLASFVLGLGAWYVLARALGRHSLAEIEDAARAEARLEESPPPG